MSKVRDFGSDFDRRFNIYVGLLVTRAYSLARGNKIIVAVLGLGFLVGLGLCLCGEEQLKCGVIRRKSDSLQKP